MRAEPRPRAAFTLIELVIVIGIIVLLAGMAMPLLQIARNSAAKTNTQSLLRKLDGGLRLFRIDVGGFPYREWSTASNAPPAADNAPPVNQLAYHLCHDPSNAEQTDLLTDVNAAGNAYETSGSACIASVDYNARKTITATYALAGNPDYAPVATYHLNRLARQRARLNIMVGNVNVKKTVKGTPWTEGAALLPAPTTKGYCFDYLSHDIPARQRVGDAILDMWGHPVVYLCPVLPGTVGYFGEGLAYNMIDTTWFGFAPKSRRSATTALASDLRDSAGSRFTFMYETWSCGPDGVISSLRTDAANKDNIPAENYLKDLQ